MTYDKPKVTIDLDEYLALKKLVRTEAEEAEYLGNMIKMAIANYDKTTTYDPVCYGFKNFIEKLIPKS